MKKNNKKERWFSSQKAREDFYKSEEIERGYLNLVYSNLPSDHDYKLYVCDAGERDQYDALLMRFEKENGVFKDRYIIEIKVRSKHYDNLMLEKKKLDGLKKVRASKDRKTNSECFTQTKSKLAYIIVSPEGTWWFPLDKLESELEWKEEEHWVSSTDKSLGREMKLVSYINCNKGKFMNIKLGDWIDPEEVKRVELESKRKKQFAGFII